MDATLTLRTLRREDYTACVESGRLKVRGPRQPSEEMLQSIRDNRGELIRLTGEGILLDAGEARYLLVREFGLFEAPSAECEARI